MEKHFLEVQVLQRAMDVLEVIGTCNEPVSLKNITEKVGLPKSTVYRILSNLESRGYVCCSNEGGYRLGLTFLTLGQKAERGFELKRLARPHMTKLNQLTNESVHLGMLARNKVLYLDSIDSPHTIRLVAQIGGNNLLHCTSLGKALLIAHSDEEIRQILVEVGMERRTHYTLVTPEAFLKEMEVVRRVGFGFDDRESDNECFCIGAPIYNHLGQILAAISVSGPISRVSRRTAETIVAPRLIEATKSISRALGHVS
ncbi:MAG: IclR family transcriptional regulator [Sporomusaceae bacterium]|nr:IclR family transcriptional regulator [Sporomusaceae bacterium]